MSTCCHLAACLLVVSFAWLIAALGIFEARFPPDHQLVALAQTNLGLYLCPTGELQEAEAFLLKACESNKRKRPNSAENGQASSGFFFSFSDSGLTAPLTRIFLSSNAGPAQFGALV